MRLFHLSIATLVLRFYLMMMIIIVAGFVGQWWLSLLALPVFMTCLMGINLRKSTPAKGFPNVTLGHSNGSDASMQDAA